MDKFVNLGNSRIKIMNPETYEKKLQEEKKEQKEEIHNRRVADVKRGAIKAAIVGAIAVGILGTVVGIDYGNWKDAKYKKAGYTKVARPDGVTWVGTGMDKEGISFGTYVDERIEELGISIGR